jgi:hypothetical protein
MKAYGFSKNIFHVCYVKLYFYTHFLRLIMKLIIENSKFNYSRNLRKMIEIDGEE